MQEELALGSKRMWSNEVLQTISYKLIGTVWYRTSRVKQLYLMPHWNRSCWPNWLSHTSCRSSVLTLSQYTDTKDGKSAQTLWCQMSGRVAPRMKFSHYWYHSARIWTPTTSTWGRHLKPLGHQGRDTVTASCTLYSSRNVSIIQCVCVCVCVCV